METRRPLQRRCLSCVGDTLLLCRSWSSDTVDTTLCLRERGHANAPVQTLYGQSLTFSRAVSGDETLIRGSVQPFPHTLSTWFNSTRPTSSPRRRRSSSRSSVNEESIDAIPILHHHSKRVGYISGSRHTSHYPKGQHTCLSFFSRCSHMRPSRRASRFAQLALLHHSPSSLHGPSIRR